MRTCVRIGTSPLIRGVIVILRQRLHERKGAQRDLLDLFPICYGDGVWSHRGSEGASSVHRYLPM